MPRSLHSCLIVVRLVPLKPGNQIIGWHQGCDAVLNMKHGGTGTKTALTLVQVLH